MRDATKQETTSKLRSLSSKKDTKEIIEKIREQTAATKKIAAQTESEDAKAQAEKENAAAARAKCDNVEEKTEEVERMCTGDMMNDGVVTANEAGGWHRGRPVLRTVNEDEDLIVFHSDHVELNTNDGLEELKVQGVPPK